MSRPIRSGVLLAPLFAALFLGVGCNGPVTNELHDDAPRMVRAEAKLCDAGEAWGCHNVALAWRDGTAGSVDVDRAMELFRRACEGGAELACIELTAEGAVPDGDPSVTAAHEVLSERCSAGVPQACEGVVRNLRAAGDRDEALELAVRRCRLSPSYVCVAAAELLREKGTPQEGRPFLRTACAGGVVAACRLQADLDMEGVQGDPGRDVFAMYTRACHSGDAESCLTLARLYTNGEGEREDPDYARLLREEACELGNQTGCAALDEQP